MKPVTLALLICLMAYDTYASQACGWRSRRAGITLEWRSDCDWQDQHRLDSIVEQMVQRINRSDTTAEVLVIINNQDVFHDSKDRRFVAIGFDKLRSIDHNYIFDTYWNSSGTGTLDYSATNKRQKTKKGLRVMYNMDYDHPTNWDDIETLVRFAIDNEEQIRKEQKRITVHCFANNNKLTLLSYDVDSLRNLIGWEQLPVKEKSQPPLPGNGSYAYQAIRFQVPNWLIPDLEETSAGEAHSFNSSPDSESISVRIGYISKDSLKSDMKSLTLEQYSQKIRNDLQAELGQVTDCIQTNGPAQKALSSGIVTTFAEVACNGGHEVMQMYFFFGVADIGEYYYHIIGVTRAKLKDKYKPVFEEVLYSVRLR